MQLGCKDFLFFFLHFLGMQPITSGCPLELDRYFLSNQDPSVWFMVGRRIHAGEVGEGMELSSILLTTMAVSTAHQ
jgi:hypothetical protein